MEEESQEFIGIYLEADLDIGKSDKNITEKLSSIMRNAEKALSGKKLNIVDESHLGRIKQVADTLKGINDSSLSDQAASLSIFSTSVGVLGSAAEANSQKIVKLGNALSGLTISLEGLNAFDSSKLNSISNSFDSISNLGSMQHATSLLDSISRNSESISDAADSILRLANNLKSFNDIKSGTSDPFLSYIYSIKAGLSDALAIKRQLEAPLKSSNSVRRDNKGRFAPAESDLSPHFPQFSQGSAATEDSNLEKIESTIAKIDGTLGRFNSSLSSAIDHIGRLIHKTSGPNESPKSQGSHGRALNTSGNVVVQLRSTGAMRIDATTQSTNPVHAQTQGDVMHGTSPTFTGPQKSYTVVNTLTRVRQDAESGINAAPYKRESIPFSVGDNLASAIKGIQANSTAGNSSSDISSKIFNLFKEVMSNNADIATRHNSGVYSPIKITPMFNNVESTLDNKIKEIKDNISNSNGIHPSDINHLNSVLDSLKEFVSSSNNIVHRNASRILTNPNVNMGAIGAGSIIAEQSLDMVRKAFGHAATKGFMIEAHPSSGGSYRGKYEDGTASINAVDLGRHFEALVKSGKVNSINDVFKNGTPLNNIARHQGAATIVHELGHRALDGISTEARSAILNMFKKEFGITYHEDNHDMSNLGKLSKSVTSNNKDVNSGIIEKMLGSGAYSPTQGRSDSRGTFPEEILVDVLSKMHFGEKQLSGINSKAIKAVEALILNGGKINEEINKILGLTKEQGNSSNVFSQLGFPQASMHSEDSPAGNGRTYTNISKRGTLHTPQGDTFNWAKDNRNIDPEDIMNGTPTPTPTPTPTISGIEIDEKEAAAAAAAAKKKQEEEAAKEAAEAEAAKKKKEEAAVAPQGNYKVIARSILGEEEHRIFAEFDENGEMKESSGYFAHSTGGKLGHSDTFGDAKAKLGKGAAQNLSLVMTNNHEGNMPENMSQVPGFSLEKFQAQTAQFKVLPKHIDKKQIAELGNAITEISTNVGDILNGYFTLGDEIYAKTKNGASRLGKFTELKNVISKNAPKDQVSGEIERARTAYHEAIKRDFAGGALQNNDSEAKLLYENVSKASDGTSRLNGNNSFTHLDPKYGRIGKRIAVIKHDNGNRYLIDEAKEHAFLLESNEGKTWNDEVYDKMVRHILPSDLRSESHVNSLLGKSNENAASSLLSARNASNGRRVKEAEDLAKAKAKAKEDLINERKAKAAKIKKAREEARALETEKNKKEREDERLAKEAKKRADNPHSAQYDALAEGAHEGSYFTAPLTHHPMAIATDENNEMYVLDSATKKQTHIGSDYTKAYKIIKGRLGGDGEAALKHLESQKGSSVAARRMFEAGKKHEAELAKIKSEKDKKISDAKSAKDAKVKRLESVQESGMWVEHPNDSGSKIGIVEDSEGTHLVDTLKGTVKHLGDHKVDKIAALSNYIKGGDSDLDDQRRNGTDTDSRHTADNILKYRKDEKAAKEQKELNAKEQLIKKLHSDTHSRYLQHPRDSSSRVGIVHGDNGDFHLVDSFTGHVKHFGNNEDSDKALSDYLYSMKGINTNDFLGAQAALRGKDLFTANQLITHREEEDKGKPIDRVKADKELHEALIKKVNDESHGVEHPLDSKSRIATLSHNGINYVVNTRDNSVTELAEHQRPHKEAMGHFVKAAGKELPAAMERLEEAAKKGHGQSSIFMGHAPAVPETPLKDQLLEELKTSPNAVKLPLSPNHSVAVVPGPDGQLHLINSLTGHHEVVQSHQDELQAIYKNITNGSAGEQARIALEKQAKDGDVKAQRVIDASSHGKEVIEGKARADKALITFVDEQNKTHHLVNEGGNLKLLEQDAEGKIVNAFMATKDKLHALLKNGANSIAGGLSSGLDSRKDDLFEALESKFGKVYTHKVVDSEDGNHVEGKVFEGKNALGAAEYTVAMVNEEGRTVVKTFSNISKALIALRDAGAELEPVDQRLVELMNKKSMSAREFNEVFGNKPEAYKNYKRRSLSINPKTGEAMYKDMGIITDGEGNTYHATNFYKAHKNAQGKYEEHDNAHAFTGELVQSKFNQIDASVHSPLEAILGVNEAMREGEKIHRTFIGGTRILLGEIVKWGLGYGLVFSALMKVKEAITDVVSESMKFSTDKFKLGENLKDISNQGKPGYDNKSSVSTRDVQLAGKRLQEAKEQLVKGNGSTEDSQLIYASTMQTIRGKEGANAPDVALKALPTIGGFAYANNIKNKDMADFVQTVGTTNNFSGKELTNYLEGVNSFRPRGLDMSAFTKTLASSSQDYKSSQFSPQIQAAIIGGGSMRLSGTQQTEAMSVLAALPSKLLSSTSAGLAARDTANQSLHNAGMDVNLSASTPTNQALEQVVDKSMKLMERYNDPSKRKEGDGKELLQIGTAMGFKDKQQYLQFLEGMNNLLKEKGFSSLQTFDKSGGKLTSSQTIAKEAANLAAGDAGHAATKALNELTEVMDKIAVKTEPGILAALHSVEKVIKDFSEDTGRIDLAGKILGGVFGSILGFLSGLLTYGTDPLKALRVSIKSVLDMFKPGDKKPTTGSPSFNIFHKLAAPAALLGTGLVGLQLGHGAYAGMRHAGALIKHGTWMERLKSPLDLLLSPFGGAGRLDPKTEALNNRGIISDRLSKISNPVADVVEDTEDKSAISSRLSKIGEDGEELASHEAQAAQAETLLNTAIEDAPAAMNTAAAAEGELGQVASKTPGILAGVKNGFTALMVALDAFEASSLLAKAGILGIIAAFSLWDFSEIMQIIDAIGGWKNAKDTTEKSDKANVAAFEKDTQGRIDVIDNVSKGLDKDKDKTKLASMATARQKYVDAIAASKPSYTIVDAKSGATDYVPADTYKENKLKNEADSLLGIGPKGDKFNLSPDQAAIRDLVGPKIYGKGYKKYKSDPNRKSVEAPSPEKTVESSLDPFGLNPAKTATPSKLKAAPAGPTIDYAEALAVEHKRKWGWLENVKRTSAASGPHAGAWDSDTITRISAAIYKHYGIKGNPGEQFRKGSPGYHGTGQAKDLKLDPNDPKYSGLWPELASIGTHVLLEDKTSGKAGGDKNSTGPHAHINGSGASDKRGWVSDRTKGKAGNGASDSIDPESIGDTPEQMKAYIQSFMQQGTAEFSSLSTQRQNSKISEADYQSGGKAAIGKGAAALAAARYKYTKLTEVKNSPLSTNEKLQMGYQLDAADSGINQEKIDLAKHGMQYQTDEGQSRIGVLKSGLDYNTKQKELMKESALELYNATLNESIQETDIHKTLLSNLEIMVKSDIFKNDQKDKDEFLKQIAVERLAIADQELIRLKATLEIIDKQIESRKQGIAIEEAFNKARRVGSDLQLANASTSGKTLDVSRADLGSTLSALKGRNLQDVFSDGKVSQKLVAVIEAANARAENLKATFKSLGDVIQSSVDSISVLAKTDYGKTAGEGLSALNNGIQAFAEYSYKINYNLLTGLQQQKAMNELVTAENKLRMDAYSIIGKGIELQNRVKMVSLSNPYGGVGSELAQAYEQNKMHGRQIRISQSSIASDLGDPTLSKQMLDQELYGKGDPKKLSSRYSALMAQRIKETSGKGYEELTQSAIDTQSKLEPEIKRLGGISDSAQGLNSIFERYTQNKGDKTVQADFEKYASAHGMTKGLKDLDLYSAHEGQIKDSKGASVGLDTFDEKFHTGLPAGYKDWNSLNEDLKKKVPSAIKAVSNMVDQHNSGIADDVAGYTEADKKTFGDMSGQVADAQKLLKIQQAIADAIAKQVELLENQKAFVDLLVKTEDARRNNLLSLYDVQSEAGQKYQEVSSQRNNIVGESIGFNESRQADIGKMGVERNALQERIAQDDIKINNPNLDASSRNSFQADKENAITSQKKLDVELEFKTAELDPIQRKLMDLAQSFGDSMSGAMKSAANAYFKYYNEIELQQSKLDRQHMQERMQDEFMPASPGLQKMRGMRDLMFENQKSEREYKMVNDPMFRAQETFKRAAAEIPGQIGSKAASFGIDYAQGIAKTAISDPGKLMDYFSGKGTNPFKSAQDASADKLAAASDATAVAQKELNTAADKLNAVLIPSDTNKGMFGAATQLIKAAHDLSGAAAALTGKPITEKPDPATEHNKLALDTLGSKATGVNKIAPTVKKLDASGNPTTVDNTIANPDSVFIGVDSSTLDANGYNTPVDIKDAASGTSGTSGATDSASSNSSDVLSTVASGGQAVANLASQVGAPSSLTGMLTGGVDAVSSVAGIGDSISKVGGFLSGAPKAVGDMFGGIGNFFSGGKADDSSLPKLPSATAGSTPPKPDASPLNGITGGLIGGAIGSEGMSMILDGTRSANTGPTENADRKMNEQIGGGLGATAGGLIGSVVPGVGTMAGAAVGGAGGSLLGSIIPVSPADIAHDQYLKEQSQSMSDMMSQELDINRKMLDATIAQTRAVQFQGQDFKSLGDFIKQDVHLLTSGSDFGGRSSDQRMLGMAVRSGHGLLAANVTGLSNTGGGMPGSGSGTLAYFNSGGTVPGIGDTDSVLAKLTPGEEVIPKNIASQYRVGTTQTAESMKNMMAAQASMQNGGVSLPGFEQVINLRYNTPDAPNLPAINHEVNLSYNKGINSHFNSSVKDNGPDFMREGRNRGIN